MITDVIEAAFRQRIVRTVVCGTDGYDEYLLERAYPTGQVDSPVRVWVRPDGRFSRASSSEGQLSLGQVLGLCGLDMTRARKADLHS